MPIYNKVIALYKKFQFLEKPYPHLWETFNKESVTWQHSQEKIHNIDRVWLGKNVKEPVLDVGCGSCVDATMFKDYAGVDITLSFLQACHCTYKVENVVRCDGKHLPFKDKIFKTAYAKGVLLHYPQKNGEEIIKEMVRVSEITYVSWGFVDNINYTPSDNPIITKQGLFWYNRYDIRELEKLFEILFVKGTTITSVKEVN